jgi:hypothetical protein
MLTSFHAGSLISWRHFLTDSLHHYVLGFMQSVPLWKMDPSETADRSTPLWEIPNTINQGTHTLLSPFNGICAYIFPIKFACTREYNGRINLQYTCIGSLHEHAINFVIYWPHFFPVLTLQSVYFHNWVYHEGVTVRPLAWADNDTISEQTTW